MKGVAPWLGITSLSNTVPPIPSLCPLIPTECRSNDILRSRARSLSQQREALQGRKSSVRAHAQILGAEEICEAENLGELYLCQSG